MAGQKKKLGDIETMMGKGSVFSVGTWVNMILGSFMLLSTFALGQKMFQSAPKYLPNGVPYDSNIEPLSSSPKTVDAMRIV